MYYSKRQTAAMPGLERIFVYYVLSLFLASGLFAQSASDFFQRGMKASSPEEKIAAYEQATQLDPNYIEAFFYLGLAYKSKQQYEFALIALNKAYFTNPYGLNDNIKSQILFALGSVHAALGKTNEAVTALIGAKKLAKKNNAMQGRIAYELGKVYIQQGDYGLALQELRQGRRLLPQNKTAFDEAILLAVDKQEINTKYSRGVSLLKSKRYTEATKIFQEIAVADPGFKNVRALLEQAEVGSKAEVSGRTGSQSPARKIVQNELLVKPNQAKSNQASKSSKRTPLNSPGQKITQNKPQVKPNQDTSKQASKILKRTQVEETAIVRAYNRGIVALQRKQWQLALEQLDAVQSSEPGYRNVEDLILQAERGLETVRKKKTQSAELYARARAFVENREWAQAAATFRNLQAIAPGYKDSEQQLVKIRDALAGQQIAMSEIDTLFQGGVHALEERDWLRAVLVFEKVKLLDPGYKGLQNKLANARFNLQRSSNQEVEPGFEVSHIFFWIGSGVSILLLPLVGALVLSPTLRARMYILKGHYLKAATVYEKVLEKKPEKIKLYPVLANIYLIEDRRDEQAIKIFETILKLNILAPKRSEMNTIVSNYYLTQGRTDGNAIAIMERELDNKLKNL